MKNFLKFPTPEVQPRFRAEHLPIKPRIVRLLQTGYSVAERMEVGSVPAAWGGGSGGLPPCCHPYSSGGRWGLPPASPAALGGGGGSLLLAPQLRVEVGGSHPRLPPPPWVPVGSVPMCHHRRRCWRAPSLPGTAGQCRTRASEPGGSGGRPREALPSGSTKLGCLAPWQPQAGRARTAHTKPVNSAILQFCYELATLSHAGPRCERQSGL